MRIQHNIMAMNAYRNYTNNVSAMKKNLEKLSSGYKINRAGDDAAGLAISEKMRAQITGLETAQKNAKDGISLVQTAEGALTEVHDMLNRMVTLATQSANGTYDNETDRVQLQKELDQLRTEINRIADSSNFNGIKLLDGSLDADGTEAVSLSANGKLPAVGEILGKDTVLHREAGTPAATTSFSLDLHNVELSGSKNQTFTLNVGGTKLIGTLQDTNVTASDIAAALGNGTTSKVTFAYEDGTAYSNTAATFGDGEFTASASGTRVTFSQTNADAVEFDPDMDVSIEVEKKAASAVATATKTDGAAASGTRPTVAVTNPTSLVATPTIGNPGNKHSVTIDLAGITLDKEAEKLTLDFGNGITVDSDAIADSDKASDTAIASAFSGKSITVDGATLNAVVSGTTVLFEAAAAGVPAGGTAQGGAINSYTVTATGVAPNAATNGKVELDFTGKTGQDVLGGTIEVGSKKFEFVKAAGDVTGTNIAVVVGDTDNAAAIATAFNTAASTTTNLNAATDVVAVSGNKVTITKGDTPGTTSTAYAVTVGKAGGSPTLTGDYNVSTTNLERKGEAAGERLASTYFKLTKDMASDGNSITIGKEKYTFTSDASKDGTAGMVYIGDLDLGKDADLITAAERLTKSAAANATYTVGHDGSRMTFTENENQNVFTGSEALTNLKNIEKSFGFETAGRKADDSRALTLQIGDTAESFNQLKVSIKDMHATGMGIADISIADQASAAQAVDVIKNAINYVSDVRGTLGATQNRLDHTINNLSVMTENIQDAESTIRDTDIAAEMMAYTKNNILIQSAQAMLAQANQVPQGVLQLLQ